MLSKTYTHLDPGTAWIGHASFLVSLGGCNVLIDPVFHVMAVGETLDLPQ